jgi:hypothetical protein
MHAADVFIHAIRKQKEKSAINRDIRALMPLLHQSSFVLSNQLFKTTQNETYSKSRLERYNQRRQWSS